MNEVAFDVETQSYNKGAWTDPRNYIISICWSVNGAAPEIVKCSPDGISRFQEVLDHADILIGFNIKFDLHWIRRAGCTFSHCRVLDYQVVDFLLGGQVHPYPSLNDLSAKHLNRLKLDKIKTDYWDQGKLTSEVPWEVLEPYAKEDVQITWDIHALNIIPPEKSAIVQLCCEDLLVLEEIETNGIRYDRKKSLELAHHYELEISKLYERNFSAHGLHDFNWGSPQQLRALLFGGTLERTEKVPNGTWKSGTKKDQPRFKTVKSEVHFPRRFEPVGTTPTGEYATDDDALSKLPSGDQLIDDLRRIRKLRKEIDTYLVGLPKKQDVGGYGSEWIFTNYNQCVTDTGRLSSSGPNVQNLSDTALSCCISRYE